MGQGAIIAGIVSDAAPRLRAPVRGAPAGWSPGYRPTGPLHIGHWAGNIENMLRLQDDPAYDCFYFIADWHMLTTHYDRTDELAAWTGARAGLARGRTSIRRRP